MDGAAASSPAGGDGSLWHMVAQMNVLSRFKTGSSTLDLLVALVLPLLLTQLGAIARKLAQLVLSGAAAGVGMHERRIAHTVTTSVPWWFTSSEDDDDDDAESAPNSALHRALLHYINTDKVLANKALAWQSAEDDDGTRGEPAG